MGTENSLGKISQINRTIKNKGLLSKNDPIINSILTNNEEEFINIDEEEIEHLPIKLHEQNRYSYYKGVVRGGITNFNYFLHDKGLMKIVGVKTLNLDDEYARVQLFDKPYQLKRNHKFLSEFKKIIWFTYREGFKGLLNRKEF